MVSTTLLTLLVIPVIYLALEGRHFTSAKDNRNRKHRETAAVPVE
jgi:hypothetical protein